MRKLVIVLTCCTVVLLAGYGGYRGYKVWKRNRMMNLARQFVAKSDGRDALLCLQQVLRADPRNLEGSRMMAQLLESGRSPRALLWRAHVVELNPGSLDDRLALAQSAMLFRDHMLATNALDGVDPAGRKTAAYHSVAGAVAALGGLVSQAEAHFAEAARLQPDNLVPELNLAVVRLHTTNELDAAEARIMLQRIESNPTNGTLRAEAMRELAADALQNRQTNSALALTQKLMAETNSTFSDRLLRLQVLRYSRSAEFKPSLASFQREAGTNSARVYELATWQMLNLGPADTLAWLRTLPPVVQTNQPTALLEAECYAVLADWKGLQGSLEKETWGELEFVRLALKARALRGQDLAEAAKTEWTQAVGLASGQKASLIMLLRFAAQWRWQNEGEDILWAIVNRYPGESWAFEALSRDLYAAGQTRPLMMLYSQAYKRVPANLDFKNNVAMTALLLEANELNPAGLAHEVYQAAPTNASFASTYAFALHGQKKDAEALKVLQQLKAKDLQSPGIAGYYGLVLKATGNTAKAKTYLDACAKAPMLPEERKLFDRARSGT